jgi:hypothetical protein
MLDRNPHLKLQAQCGFMPYGGEQADHDLLSQLNIKPYLFSKNPNKMQLVYAGAMLPKAYGPLEAIFKSIQLNSKIFKKVEFHFIGTGKSTQDPNGFNIKPLAEKYGLWQSVVFEYPQRIPYLNVLIHLQQADGVFILGSTEPHYTPSKIYQAVLSKKPLLAVLHSHCTAVNIIRNSNSGSVLDFKGEEGVSDIINNFCPMFNEFISYSLTYVPANVDQNSFSQYSAKEVTRKLANLLNKVA